MRSGRSIVAPLITLTGTATGYLRQFSYSEPRFSLVLLSVFASVGLILVAVGVYSVIAYTVARQTREIGIRMALGAGRRDVLQMVSAMGLRLIAIGAAVGLLASFAATRLIATQLTGVSPHDPLTLIGVVGLMALVGFAACYFPAQKASRVDPLVALADGVAVRLKPDTTDDARLMPSPTSPNLRTYEPMNLRPHDLTNQRSSALGNCMLASIESVGQPCLLVSVGVAVALNPWLPFNSRWNV